MNAGTGVSSGHGLSRRRVGTVIAFVLLVLVGRQVAPNESRATTATIVETPAPASTGPLSVEAYIVDGLIRHRVRDHRGNVVATELTPSQIDLRYPELRPTASHGASPFGVVPAPAEPR